MVTSVAKALQGIYWQKFMYMVNAVHRFTLNFANTNVMEKSCIIFAQEPHMICDIVDRSVLVVTVGMSKVFWLVDLFMF